MAAAAEPQLAESPVAPPPPEPSSRPYSGIRAVLFGPPGSGKGTQVATAFQTISNRDDDFLCRATSFQTISYRKDDFLRRATSFQTISFRKDDFLRRATNFLVLQ
jgi:hypothetical protein